MSDLGRLFRLRSTPELEPLENFTTTALAIAIGHDDRPMRAALDRIDWTDEAMPPPPRPAGLSIALDDSTAITAKTQVTLWPGDGDLGYLDLVLEVQSAEHGECVIWVEVKVDAWESGSQLTNYRKHASHREPVPTIITLGRCRVRDSFPSLTWADIVAAIDLVQNPHYAWLSLRDFLVEERIVRRPLPPDLTSADSAKELVEVIVEVNGKVRELWPELAWRDGDLRSKFPKWIEAGETCVSAGPLKYGLMADGEARRWCLAVTASKNYERVVLDARQMLRDAEIGGLPQEWRRHPDRHDVTLERHVSLEQLTLPDEVVLWFDEGLRQLGDAKIMDRFLAGLAGRQGV